jgi:hypothetical protein
MSFVTDWLPGAALAIAALIGATLISRSRGGRYK